MTTRVPYYEDDAVTVLHGDCLEVLAELPDASVDSVVTDPPYGLSNTSAAQVAETVLRWTNGERDYLPGGAGFMGKAWDAFVPPVAVWDECLRILKPGGHVLAFAGSRTHDLMALALRLAGFEIRDGIAWLYGSGFPKSLDVSKAIDAHLGAEREVLAETKAQRNADSSWAAEAGTGMFRPGERTIQQTAPATPEAELWQGWGTALKPAFEPVVVARKPLAGTVVANVLEHGTGALNIDGCRVGDEEMRRTKGAGTGVIVGKSGSMAGPHYERVDAGTVTGRWPTNVVLDESQAAELDRQSGTSTSRRSAGRNGTDTAKSTWGLNRTEDSERGYDDEGGASRFFPVFRYEPKAPTSERPRIGAGFGGSVHNERCQACGHYRVASNPCTCPEPQFGDGGVIAHPTVKPLDLMRWLVRLVTPSGGLVLEPFAGSGTTAEACIHEHMRCIAIEREDTYLPLIRQRLTKPIELGFDLEGLTA